MARKKSNIDIGMTPSFPTAIHQRYPDGRVVTIRQSPGDGGVWLCRAVPLGPVVDAVSPAESLRPGEPIMDALEELAAMTSKEISLSRRRTAKSAYRHIQLVLANVPRLFIPPPGDLSAHLRGAYPNQEMDKRVLMLAVRLNPKVDTSGFLAAISSVAETFMEGVFMDEYAADYKMVDDVLSRAGLRVPTDDEFQLADAWWNQGRPDVPYLPHGDHMHFFNSAEASRAAAVLQGSGQPCKEWPDIAGSHTISFASAFGFEGRQFLSEDSPLAWWAYRMLRSGAVGISIRGRLEPSKVTAAELRRMRQKYLNDIKERYAHNKMSDAAQDEMKGLLDSVEGFYQQGAGTPTLTETSIIVGFTGRDEQRGYDPTGLSDVVGMGLAPMLHVQEKAFAETMIGSAVRANPRLSDLPIQSIAFSGLPNLSTVGDKNGVLVGFTEHDRQPAWLSATASFDRSLPPFAICPASTGSGKTLLLQHLANQFARERNRRGERRPVILFDPKTNSDLSAVVAHSGGTTVSLDNLISADGMIDPIRCIPNKEVAVQMANNLIMDINPFGLSQADVEVALMRALSVGANHGAGSSLHALRIAHSMGQCPDFILQKVTELAESNPVFSSICGTSENGPRLTASEGITYFRVGDTNIEPNPGETAPNLVERIKQGFIRAFMYASVEALRGRQGVLMIDEAWVILKHGAGELESIGRLARSMEYLPILFTQRVTDITNAELHGYISRGFIMHLKDRKEARAACELFGIDPTTQVLDRITGQERSGAGGQGGFNWQSLKALIDEDTRRVYRGSVAYYCDLNGMAVPTEIVVPKSFLRDASTTSLDKV